MEEGAVEQYGEAGELGLDLPESVMAQIVSGASGAADTVLAETGVYAGIAQSLAGFIVQGIAFVTVLILSWILVHVISALLGIVSHIPILKGVNRFTGMLACKTRSQRQKNIVFIQFFQKCALIYIGNNHSPRLSRTAKGNNVKRNPDDEKPLHQPR